MRFLTSEFFHESIVPVPRPHINIPKYFRKYFRFRRNIYEERIFSYLFPGYYTWRLYNFRVWLPGGCATSRLLYPETVQPLGIVTWIPGNCTTSRNSNPEIGTKKPFFVNISAKTKIFSKIFWDDDLGPRYYRFMKKTEVKNLMLLSL